MPDTPKIYADPKPYGPIIQRVLSSPNPTREKARIASELDLKSFSMDGFDVEVLTKTVIGDLLELTLSVHKDGVEVVAKNPYRFLGVRTSIPDGTFRKSVIEGVEYDVPNFVENPTEAFKIMIIHTLSQQFK